LDSFVPGDDEVRLYREVRIGELIAALTLLSGIAMAYIEGRVRPVEVQLEEIKVQYRVMEERAEIRAESLKREFREDLHRMENKLDIVLRKP